MRIEVQEKPLAGWQWRCTDGSLTSRWFGYWPDVDSCHRHAYRVCGSDSYFTPDGELELIEDCSVGDGSFNGFMTRLRAIVGDQMKHTYGDNNEIIIQTGVTDDMDGMVYLIEEEDDG